MTKSDPSTTFDSSVPAEVGSQSSQITLSITQGHEQEPVLITGNGFGPLHEAGSIAFDGVPAHIVSWTNQNILTFVPYGARSGSLTVLTKDGQSFSAEFIVLPGVWERPD